MAEAAFTAIEMVATVAVVLIISTVGGRRGARVGAMNINDANRRIALDAITTSLRNITSIRDFVAAVEVGGKVANDMLTEIETKLLDTLNAIGEGE
jgi:hypothetical protein